MQSHANGNSITSHLHFNHSTGSGSNSVSITKLSPSPTLHFNLDNPNTYGAFSLSSHSVPPAQAISSLWCVHPFPGSWSQIAPSITKLLSSGIPYLLTSVNLLHHPKPNQSQHRHTHSLPSSFPGTAQDPPLPSVLSTTSVNSQQSPAPPLLLDPGLP